MNTDTYKNFLGSIGKLYYNKYSFTNALLVNFQRPDATHVMGYEQWKEYGRNVNQGAKGINILIPVMAGENVKGGLFSQLNRNLQDQLAKNPSLEQANYKLGNSNIEFGMNRSNRLVGLKINGREKGIFDSDDKIKQYIERSILGKTPLYYNTGTVFDVKDTIVPEYLWLKKGFAKHEIAADNNGNPIKNRKGETKINNTPEREAKLKTELDMSITTAQDPSKMTILFDACVAVNENKGVPVYLKNKENDKSLASGAKGYFSREFSEKTPNGYIAIDEHLEITERCAVMFHEMGHADLHKSLENLAQKMGEDRVPKNMREIQAESVAYMTAANFGIETDTSSFVYLSVYANGFELQDLQKSLEVIYKESQELTNDLTAELGKRGLNFALTEKSADILSKEAIDDVASIYSNITDEQEWHITSVLKELPALAAQNQNIPDMMDILKGQKRILDLQKDNTEDIKSAVSSLRTAENREAQNIFIARSDAANKRIQRESAEFDKLNERFIQIKYRIENELQSVPEKISKTTFDELKPGFPNLAKLSEAQLNYIAQSRYISKEYERLLHNDVQKFTDKACKRAESIGNCASENGTFVEINYCGKLNDKPIFENGVICHPKIADNIITQAEIQIKKLRDDGKYTPNIKCDITIFSPTETKKGLSSLNVRFDIGNMPQNGLNDYLKKIAGIISIEKSEATDNFNKAIHDRGAEKKIYIPSDTCDEKHDCDEANFGEKIKTADEWRIAIAAKRQESEKRPESQPITKEKEKTDK